MKKLSSIILLYISIFGCVPTDSPNPEGELLSEEELAERNQECDLYLSFAHTNFSNREYSGAVENFNEVMSLGCSERNAEDIFPWIGRSYIELGKNDSASFLFKKGMKYLDENSDFLGVYAWNEGKLNKLESQIFLLEKQLSLDDSNVKVLEELSEIYRENENFKEHDTNSEDELAITEGSIVRAIRQPYFGMVGKVIDLPSELTALESGTLARVAKVEFDDKKYKIIPRTNLELIIG